MLILCDRGGYFFSVAGSRWPETLGKDNTAALRRLSSEPALSWRQSRDGYQAAKEALQKKGEWEVKSKKKKSAMLKRAKAGVKGLIATWVDPDPFKSGGANFSDMAVSHKNPIYRLTAEKILHDFGDWIIAGTSFNWLINLDVVFVCQNGDLLIESRELEAFARMEDLNPYCFEAIEGTIKEASEISQECSYKYVKFTVECWGV